MLEENTYRLLSVCFSAKQMKVLAASPGGLGRGQENAAGVYCPEGNSLQVGGVPLEISLDIL